jgi:hypothetical protein
VTAHDRFVQRRVAILAHCIDFCAVRKEGRKICVAASRHMIQKGRPPDPDPDIRSKCDEHSDNLVVISCPSIRQRRPALLIGGVGIRAMGEQKARRANHVQFRRPVQSGFTGCNRGVGRRAVLEECFQGFGKSLFGRQAYGSAALFATNHLGGHSSRIGLRVDLHHG